MTRLPMDDETARAIADDLADWVSESGEPRDVIPVIWDLLVGTAPARATRPRIRKGETDTTAQSVLPLEVAGG